MTTQTPQGAQTAADQVSRMLALVPYIARRPGVTITELATEFSVDSEQITADLNLLMVCGEPGYYPNELIDVVLHDEGGSVSIAYDAGIDRPVRLNPDEAVALTVALRALGDIPDLLDSDAVHSALAKLEAAAAGPIPPVAVAPADPTPAISTVRRALEQERRLWIRYYTASRDAVTEREVDPTRLLVVDGHSYVEGYCYAAGASRRFRLDRIDEIRMLQTPIQPPLWVDDEVPSTLYTAGPTAESVILELAPSAAWVAEYYVMDEVAPVADRPGYVRVQMRATDDEWIIRLVLSLGGAAVMVNRPDLGESVRLRAQAALACYDSDSGRDSDSGSGSALPPTTA